MYVKDTSCPSNDSNWKSLEDTVHSTDWHQSSGLFPKKVFVWIFNEIFFT